MLKEEKGMTLVGLSLIIVVLLIFAGLGVVVFIQNSDFVTVNESASIENSNPNNVKTSEKEAQTKVKLIFELLEANYQTELAKGNVTDRKEIFSADNIIEKLTEYDVNGNTQSSLGRINLTSGIKVNYDELYTFIVRINDYGVVTVTNK